jgi:ABC-type Fe3+/spermidine/putrescine transport system ATPase subunit
MIQIEDLHIHLGEFHLRNISLQINEGEYFVLLGPTGAGKSVLLECIAGIYAPDSGSICINGRDVTRFYPEERNAGYVPQDYALFPNMTVQQNIGYGLKARKRSASDIHEKVAGMMEQLGVTHLQDRSPLFLSGGEKQRVALGRALITQPGILLLDEPLSALDENLRSQLAGELRRIQQNWNRAFLHVCHSFEEASFVADRIAIMRQGTIEQVGTIQEILSKPSSLFIAEFTRMRNFHKGIAERVNGLCRITISSGHILYSNDEMVEGPVTFGIRPEEIAFLSENNSSKDGNHLKARVVHARFRPSSIEIELDAGFPIIAYHPWHSSAFNPLDEGAEVWIHIRPEAVKVFPQAPVMTK